MGERFIVLPFLHLAEVTSVKKIAVVTGASSGLGREYVKLIDERGVSHPKDRVAEIWVIARRKERLEELRKEVHTPLKVILMDLTDPSFEGQIRALYEAEKPDIRLLVNSAGFGKIGSYADISDESAGRMVDLNCKAPVLMCQLSIPYMHEGARILNVCSTAGFSAFQYLGIYCATKSFLYRYSRSLRVELFSHRISVTAVCPYWVRDTEFIPVAENRNPGSGSDVSQTRADTAGHQTIAGHQSKSKGHAGSKVKAETPVYIRHFPLSSTKKTVAAWSMADTWHRFAVSTPGPVCTLHRIFAKVIPNELMAGIWALIRRV